MNHNNEYELSGGSRRAEASFGAVSRFTTRTLVLAALFAALTSVLAFVRIPLPFSPVPVTGLTFGVMLAGVLLGPRLGAVSMLVYVLMGAVGLPVFAGGTAGMGVLIGPTGGYIWGGIAGAYVAGLVTVGRERERDRVPGRLSNRARHRRLSLPRALCGTVLGGIAVVYAAGVLQLALVTGMAWREALLAGVVPFLIGDGLKAATAAAVAVRLAPIVGHRTR